MTTETGRHAPGSWILTHLAPEVAGQRLLRIGARHSTAVYYVAFGGLRWQFLQRQELLRLGQVPPVELGGGFSP